MGTRQKTRKMRSRRAVSPAKGTVILFAIVITVAGAVSYWMGGLAGRFTQFEKVEIQSATCSVNGGNWTIEMKLKNTGTKDSTLVSLFINEEKVDVYDASDREYMFTGVWATNMTQNETITSSDTICFLVYIDPTKAGSTLTSGTMVTIKIHSRSGIDYPKTIKLV